MEEESHSQLILVAKDGRQGYAHQTFREAGPLVHISRPVLYENSIRSYRKAPSGSLVTFGQAGIGCVYDSSGALTVEQRRTGRSREVVEGTVNEESSEKLPEGIGCPADKRNLSQECQHCQGMSRRLERGGSSRYKLIK